MCTLSLLGAEKKTNNKNSKSLWIPPCSEAMVFYFGVKFLHGLAISDELHQRHFL